MPARRRPGAGASVETVAKLVRLSHRYEAGSTERATRLAAMRTKVAQLTDAIAASKPLPNQGRPNKDNNVMFPPTEQQGNSREYTLRRLQRDRPELAEMVIAGELSANATPDDGDPASVSLATLRRCWAPHDTRSVTHKRMIDPPG